MSVWNLASPIRKEQRTRQNLNHRDHLQRVKDSHKGDRGVARQDGVAIIIVVREGGHNQRVPWAISSATCCMALCQVSRKYTFVRNLILG